MTDAPQRVLITGATRGIGLAIARGFAESGWEVLATGLDAPNRADEPANLSFAELDVTDEAAVRRLVAAQPSLQAVVNAAGIIARDKEFQLPMFEQVVDVNLTGAMRVSTAAREKLAERGGSIVNVASMLSFFGGGSVPAYAASKGGIAQLTKSLAIAWADDNIRVNAIAPGWIETDMTAALRADTSRNQSILSRTPMGRWGRPEEMVGPVLFLASPAASFITGAILAVDGGYACG